MKSSFTKTHLFFCPIYKIKIDPELYDNEKILSDILYNKSLKNIRNDIHQSLGRQGIMNHNIHHSHRDFDNENFRSINYEKLLSTYSNIIDDFFNNEINPTKKIQYNFKIVNYTAMTEGQNMPMHSHIPCDFSCIHYLKYNEYFCSGLFLCIHLRILNHQYGYPK